MAAETQSADAVATERGRGPQTPGSTESEV